MQFFEQMIGTWRLEREIDDRRAGVVARLEGQLDVRWSGDDLELIESGQWVDAPWGALPVERRDVWRRGGQTGGQSVDVFFDHGGFFHSFTPAKGQQEVTHFCAPDTYKGRYAFEDLGSAAAQWRLTWQVHGPHKDYTSKTRFTSRRS